MRRVITIVGVLVALAGATATVAHAFVWHTVAKRSVSGFSVTAFSRTIKHPNGMRLRVSHNNGGSVADWSVACSKGFTVRSKGGTWHPRSSVHTHKIPRLFTSAPDSCIVVVSVGTSGAGHHATYRLQKH